MSETRRTARGGPAVNRRLFLAGSAGGMALPLAAAGAQARAPDAPEADAGTIDLQVNGQRHSLALDARATLLDTLRDDLGLTGTKKGCDHGQCGACTVHLGGRRVLSCLTLAAMAEGQEVTTVEGLTAADGGLHPMQQAFIDQDAFQCGYCTPGQIMSAVACIDEGHAGSPAEIREYMSGNLCRCGAYPNIVAAIRQVAEPTES